MLVHFLIRLLGPLRTLPVLLIHLYQSHLLVALALYLPINKAIGLSPPKYRSKALPLNNLLNTFAYRIHEKCNESD